MLESIEFDMMMEWKFALLRQVDKFQDLPMAIESSTWLENVFFLLFQPIIG